MADSENNLSKENWKTFPGFEKYEVSDLGRVRIVKDGSVEVISQQARDDKYLHVHLRVDGGKRRTRLVHVAVAEAFLGPKPAGLVVRHRNRRKDCNHANNLFYAHPRDVQLLAEAHHGFKPMRKPKACDPNVSKEVIAEILSLLRQHHSGRPSELWIAKKFRISMASVRLIRSGVIRPL